MPKMSSRKNQKMYKMRGCSKTRKNHLGGSADLNLAYTGEAKPNFLSGPNPNLAYTGTGGSSSQMPLNTNASNPAFPNTGPVANGAPTIFNNASTQLGGCGCGLAMSGGGKMNSGGCGPLCTMGFMVAGARHRKQCKCSECKKKRTSKKMKGGSPYPNGLVGSGWGPEYTKWPGTNYIPGDRNYLPLNTYNNDVSRQMVDLGANKPFLNMKAGKNRKQKGGTLSNFMGQDLINLGRQFQFGIGSAYNALAGYSSPVNPLPWKDHFPTKLPFNTAAI